jgi:hypothetical protein
VAGIILGKWDQVFACSLARLPPFDSLVCHYLTIVHFQESVKSSLDTYLYISVYIFCKLCRVNYEFAEEVNFHHIVK